MKACRTAVLLGLSLVAGSAAISAASRASATALAAEQADFYPAQRPQYFQVSGTCSMEISPDQAVILGGVSSSALKPEEAVSQLEKELTAMRGYLADKHGEMEMLERVRTLKNPQPDRAETELPFEVVQRLQVKLPADAPVDAILQKLIELGFDRFGDNILGNYNRREPVIRFRNSQFEAKMADFQRQCTASAWKQWCTSPAGSSNCPSETAPYDLELQVFNVHSRETLMRPEGVSTPWQFNVGRGQAPQPPPDLLGNVSVHLDANILLMYHREEAKP